MCTCSIVNITASDLLERAVVTSRHCIYSYLFVNCIVYKHCQYKATYTKQKIHGHERAIPK